MTAARMKPASNFTLQRLKAATAAGRMLGLETQHGNRLEAMR